MRCFVFTYDRFDSITTCGLLDAEGIAHTTLCHTAEQRDRFIEAGRVRADTLVATGEPRGLANNRNVALEMMEPGEWALFLVDDLLHITQLDDYDDRTDTVLQIDVRNAAEWRPKFKAPCTMAQFVGRAESGITETAALGGNLLGWAGNTNPLFRRRHWAVNVLADGRAWAVRKTDLRFDTGAQMIDDLCWTAQNIDRFGVVLVDQWVLPTCRRYTAGGFGSIEDRMPQKLAEAAHLVATYPHLIQYKAKPGWPERSHVVLRRQRRLRAEVSRA